MSTKTIISFTLLILLAAGSAFVLWQYTKSSSPTEEAESEASEAHGDLPEEKRQATEDGENKDEKNTDDNSEEETSENSDISILLNNFGQRDGTVYANATVSGARDGTCEFRFTQNGSSITETTEIEQALTGYYACGVRIDNSRFTPKGMWTARVHIQNTDPRAKSDTKKTGIE